MSEPTPEQVRLATAELLGALTYGQLRAFQATATAVAAAPDFRRADRLAAFARTEHGRYRMLRDHLVEVTDLAAPVVDRQREVFDEYFDAVLLGDWRDACVFFVVGIPIAADFGTAMAPSLASETADVVVAALADREPFEQWALEELEAQLAGDEEIEQVRHLVADMLGRALSGYQGVIADSDALAVLLLAHEGEDGDPDALVRRVAVDVISGHRRRMDALGIDQPG